MANKLGRIPLGDKVRELARIYGTIEREIAREMASVDIGNYRELKAFSTQRKIDKLIKMLNRSAMRWSMKAVPEAYEKGHTVAETRLEILGIEKDGGFQNKTHRQTIEYQIEKTMDILIRANQSIKMNVATFLYLAREAARGLSQFQAFDMRDEEFIDELLGDALREGETRGYAMKVVREYYQKRFGDAKFIRINGRNYELRAYADLVAKTRLRVVQTEAVLNTCKEFDNDLVQVSDHGTDCMICLPYEGNVYSLSGRSSAYPYLDSYPPWHPRCLADGNSRILTDKGLIPIRKIKIGDMIFTHKGRFKPVTNVFKRKFKGQLIWINGLGITYNHKMFTESGLIPAGNLTREDKLFELSPKLIKVSGITIKSDYFPSQRRKIHIPFSIFFNSIIMSSTINFKINISNSKIKKINTNRFLLNIINSKFIKYISNKFSHFRLIFYSPFSDTFCHFFSNFWIRRRIIINHPDFIFPICLRSGISNTSSFKSTSRSSFNFKMIKNILNPMSISTIQTNNFSNISNGFTRIIIIVNYFFERLFKFRLNSFDFIKELFSFPANERASFGIPKFDRISADNTDIHNDSFKIIDINKFSPIMLPYFGQVFNIEVQDDHSYVAEGFLVKNCQHNISPTSEVALEARERWT